MSNDSYAERGLSPSSDGRDQFWENKFSAIQVDLEIQGIVEA